jgi:hypothetical protein
MKLTKKEIKLLNKRAKAMEETILEEGPEHYE